MATDLPSYQSEVLSLTHVANDYYELKVKIPAGLHWQSGQYIRLGLPTKAVTDQKKVRALSPAAPEEAGYLQLATRTRQTPSSFKTQLLELQPGEAVTIYGPLGNFTLPTLDHPLVMFASGVGITPLRALIQDALSQKTTNPIELIFTAHDYHLYQADFEAWAAQHANFHLHIVKNRQAAQAALLATTQHYGNTADYFLSGSETVIDAVQTFLTTTGAINADQIHRDVLYGY